MRRRAAGFVAAIVLATACSDQKGDQFTTPSNGPTANVTAPICSPSLQQNLQTASDLINQLFSGGNLNAAQTRFQQIVDLLNAPPPTDFASAQSNTYNLIGFTLDKLHQGQLNDLTSYSGGTNQAVTDLTNLLYCISGIDAILDPLGDDGNATLYQPGSPAQTLLAPSGHSGVQLPPGTGTVTQPTVISLSRIHPDFPGPLLTQLDQYPLYYEYKTSSGELFQQDAVVEICLPENLTFPPPDPSRLRLAHNVPEPNFTTIEILPPGTAFLDCAGTTVDPPGPLSTTGSTLGSFAARGWQGLTGRLAAVLAPRALYAAALATGTGTVSKTRTFSPFGAVDTAAFISAASPTSGETAAEGGTVTAPKAQVLTPLGNPLTNIAVGFSVTSSAGKLTAVGDNTPVTSVATTTDAQGFAAVGSWILGSGTNTVTAVATPPHLNSVIEPSAGVVYTATGYPATKLGFTVQPTTTTAGTAFSVTVAVQDQFGRTVPASSASVTLALNAGNGATLLGTKTVSATQGVATFSGLSIQKAGTGYTLTATSTGLTSATSDAFNIGASTAALISINGGNNQTAAEGSVLGTTVGTTAPSVKVTDQYGNPVAAAGVTFLVASGAGSVNPTGALTNASGVASTGWTIVAGTNTMNASITALGPLPDVTFTATGTSSSVALTTCPVTTGSGDELVNAFYVKRPGKTLKQVTLYLSANRTANIPIPYTIQLIAGGDSYGSTIGSSTETAILRGNSSQNLPVQFTFSNVSMLGYQNITFRFNVISNPDGAKLTFNSGPCGLGNTQCKALPPTCSGVTETTGITPLPLSTFRRKGVAMKILGN